MEKTILLVDDERDLREVLEISLTDLGYRVLTADTGEKALEIFKDQKPLIVLTDIRMPGMDGIDLLQKIKEENSNTEVIMITGYGDIDIAVRSLKYEATDFITKPINDDALEIALKRAQEKIAMKLKLNEYTGNLEKLVNEIFGLSHTIKTIASGLEGGTYVLEKGLDLDSKEYVTQGWEMVRNCVDKVKELSLGLLNYTKPMELNYKLCDPNIPAKEVYELTRSRAEFNGVDLKLDLNTKLKPVYIDPEGIQQCLLNLVSNAIDAVTTEENPITSKRVVLKSIEVESWGVEYQVLDYGCGINEEIKGKIFNQFFSTKGAQGIGIGLMLTKKIVLEHKGTLEVESEKSSHTKFIIRLP